MSEASVSPVDEITTSLIAEQEVLVENNSDFNTFSGDTITSFAEALQTADEVFVRRIATEALIAPIRAKNRARRSGMARIHG